MVKLQRIYKIVDLRFMDSLDLINECYDHSKAMAFRLDTACLKWGIQIMLESPKACVHPKSPRKWRFLLAVK